jgi:hypothetical protein
MGWVTRRNWFLQVYPGWAGHPDGFLQVNTLLLYSSLSPYGRRHEYTRFAWAGGIFFPVVLLCCVSVWFWREKGFHLHMHVLLRVQYSCGGVLVIWFWWEIDFSVTHIISVQYSCAVVSLFWL